MSPHFDVNLKGANISNPIELTPTEETRTSSDVLLPIIAKVEDVIAGEDRKHVFFSLIALAIVGQYPGMTDDQISKGIDRIAVNICQMCSEFEFENLMKERVKEQEFQRTAN